MPYSLFKKYRPHIYLLICSFIVPVAYAGSSLLGNNDISLNSSNIVWISLYAGMLLALAAYNFLLFFSLRSINYLYYALLTTAILLASGAITGLWLSVLWPNSPHWNELSFPIGLALAGLFSAQFSRSFLSTSSLSPKLDKVFYRLSFAFGLTLIFTPIAPSTSISYAVIFLIIILCFTAIVASIKTSLQGQRASQIYLIAWLALLLGIILSVTYQFGWLPEIRVAHYALSFSALLFELLLSFALAYRIIITRSQTVKFHQQVIANSNVKVAEQVKEQTAELTQLNEQLRQQEGALKKLAFYDTLTGLANRVFIQEQLKQLLVQSKRNKTKVSILFLDLDNFKPINDEHGRKVGDEVLTIIADRLQSTLRENDVVGRLGCDKFLVLLESTREDIHAPQEVADKIKATIAQPISMDWFILHIVTSIGIAHYPNDGHDAASLISVADSAMQKNKDDNKAKRQ